MIDEFKRWLVHSYKRASEQGWEGASESAFQLYKGLWRFGTHLPIGTNVYEYDWDVLIVLNGCQFDLMREVSDEYDFIESVGTIYSVGSHSIEWTEQTFTQNYLSEINETIYVTANPHSDAIGIDTSELREVDEVWRYGFDDNLGTIPPQVVTDRAIRADRTHRPEWLVVHYMQPHQPFITAERERSRQLPLADAVGADDKGWSPGDVGRNNVWRRYRRGELTYEEVWDPYKDTLRMVLDDVEVLLDTLGTRTVAITADHGNAIGEWKMYGHTHGFVHPSVRRVPWVETTGRDASDYEPASWIDNEEPSSVGDVLKALGYVE